MKLVNTLKRCWICIASSIPMTAAYLPGIDSRPIWLKLLRNIFAVASSPMPCAFLVKLPILIFPSETDTTRDWPVRPVVCIANSPG